MKTIPKIIISLLIAVSLSFLYFSCKKSDNSATPVKTTQQLSVKVDTSSTLGAYLTDKNGVAVYFFSDDYKGINTCNNGCQNYWPVFYAGNITKDSISSNLNIADFDTIIVGGIKQTRYKGWPLYYYSPNGNGVKEAAGMISGDGSDGVWFVAKPNYTIMIANGQLVGSDGNNYTSTYTVGLGTTVYMTDDRGLTLYTYTIDSFKVNEFTNASFSNNSAWPIYQITTAVVPSALNASLFSFTTIDTYSQITYNGWPLYYFGQDNKVRGSNKGVSYPVVGKWHVAVQNISAAPNP